MQTASQYNYRDTSFQTDSHKTRHTVLLYLTTLDQVNTFNFKNDSLTYFDNVVRGTGKASGSQKPVSFIPSFFLEISLGRKPRGN